MPMADLVGGKIGAGPETTADTALRLLIGAAGGDAVANAFRAYNGARAGDYASAARSGLAALLGGAPMAAGAAAPRTIGTLLDAGTEDAGQGLARASLASMLYNPRPQPPRPFAADYPAGAASDGAGRLAFDIEGQPLIARNISGRRTVGGADQAISPAEFDPIATALTGNNPMGVAPGAIRGKTGVYRVSFSPETGEPVRQILFRRDLAPEQLVRVIAHEVGHAIDSPFNSGGIDQGGIIRELRGVYNDLNNPDLQQARAAGRDPGITSAAKYRNYGPEQQGYPAAQVPGELMAEAVRAYMTDPNYLKTVAPNVAARIRQAANRSPLIAPTIQFNSLGPIAAGAGLLGILGAGGMGR